MPSTSAQEFLFQRIREMSSPQSNLAEIISGLLHISIDSAYRRIRGETPLVMDEAAELCRHFHISLDPLIGAKAGDVLFQNVHISNQQLSYHEYLEGLNRQLSRLEEATQKEVIYMSKDLPIFHNFYFRPLIAFRYFFWMKTQFLHPEFENKQFRFDILPADIETLSREITRKYSLIPSTEMWNIESINSTISQIEFSRDSGHFSSAGEVRLVYDALEESIQHMKLQAEHGVKFMPGEEPLLSRPNFKFFFNRVVLGDNTVMVIADTNKSVFINYGNLNYIRTTDEDFCNELYSDFENLIRRSTQISQTSEKQRNIFFHILLSKIRERKQNL